MFTFQKDSSEIACVSWRPEKITLICFLLCVYRCCLDVFAFTLSGSQQILFFGVYEVVDPDHSGVFFSNAISGSVVQFFKD